MPSSFVTTRKSGTDFDELFVDTFAFLSVNDKKFNPKCRMILNGSPAFSKPFLQN